MAKIIGITGPSGAGKSLLCKYISEAGIPCINADEVYHSMLTPNSRILSAIANALGDDLISADGSLDRAALSARVFCDKEKLRTLNATVLPLVIDEIERIISTLEGKNHSVIAVDAPTLIESGFHKRCDTVISVLSPRQTRIERIMARDSIPRENAEARVRAQKSDSFYISVSDIVLTNDTDENTFARTARDTARMLINP
jgi:dephospho-CoA kinase